VEVAAPPLTDHLVGDLCAVAIAMPWARTGALSRASSGQPKRQCPRPSGGQSASPPEQRGQVSRCRAIGSDGSPVRGPSPRPGRRPSPARSSRPRSRPAGRGLPARRATIAWFVPPSAWVPNRRRHRGDEHE
jgi:hypothetical protein